MDAWLTTLTGPGLALRSLLMIVSGISDRHQMIRLRAQTSIRFS
jgi:hypothetical protein